MKAETSTATAQTMSATMYPCPCHLHRSSLVDRRSAGGRRGFSFTEVLFAVMILGIGFIMIAGIFPVAISQTAATQEETIGASTARGAVGAISSVPNLAALIPASGQVVRLTDDPWNLVKGNQILPDEPRFGWIPLIKRDATDYRGQPPSTAQLIVIPVQIRGEAAFSNADLVQTGTGTSAEAALMPYEVTVDLQDKADAPDECTVSGTHVDAAAPGAVIVLPNGKIYRLGDRINDSATQYYLLAGNDLPLPADNYNGPAYIVGRRKLNGVFTGTSMAIGAYVTFIPLR